MVTPHLLAAQSPEHLLGLFAVGPDLWTAWREATAKDAQFQIRRRSLEGGGSILADAVFAGCAGGVNAQHRPHQRPSVRLQSAEDDVFGESHFDQFTRIHHRNPSRDMS